ncbi:Hypothetical protein SCF082_LOCUS16285 [Durusdinium trenchii]|uniref:N-acetyltransferase domain-containing protein n=2 Tax=Durusdinium trenchii TaxID=1381693 RepID=A0ABP0KA17_9DINO
MQLSRAARWRREVDFSEIPGSRNALFAHSGEAFPRALTRGARALPAGSIGDDRFAMVDAETAHSLCTGLHRYLCQHDCGRILLATCKKSVLPFLQPDFVIELLPDKAVVHRNGHGISALTSPMRPMVSINTAVERFAGGPGGGWRGPEESLDDMPLQSRTGQRIPGASVREEFQVSVGLDECTAAVSKAFDHPFDGSIKQKCFRLKPEALSFSWSIGAIIGPSGSGKSTNLKNFGQGLPFQWDPAKSVWDQLPYGDKKKLLEAVTLGEAAARRSYDQLSAGERSLAQLARSLCSNGSVITVDEFTSLLDRHRAYQVCTKIHPFIMERGIQLVVAGCHKDIADWLRVNWVFEADSGELLQVQDFTVGSPPPRIAVSFEVPKIDLVMRRLETSTRSRNIFASHFEAHHYMDGLLPTGLYGQLIRTTSGELVAFHAVSAQPGQIHNAMRESRLVVLPPWQGYGIGPRASTLAAELIVASGMRLFCKTSQEALGSHRSKAPYLWRPTTTNGKPMTASLSEGFTRKRKREAKRLEGGSARHEGDVVDNIDVEPPVFDADCVACVRERDGVRRAGRPPKHTCGRAPKAPLDNDIAHRRPVVRRVCYSHEYIGPGRHQQKGPVEDVNEEELKASTMLKLMTTEQIPEMAEIVLV